MKNLIALSIFIVSATACSTANKAPQSNQNVDSVASNNTGNQLNGNNGVQNNTFNSQKPTQTKAVQVTEAKAEKAVSPTPTPQPIALSTFASNIPEGTRIYKAQYRSVDGLESVFITLDCKVDTNLAKVRKSYSFAEFKIHVRQECPNAILPVEIPVDVVPPKEGESKQK